MATYVSSHILHDTEEGVYYMEHPQSIQLVELDGKHLTLESFVAVARYGAKVALTDAAKALWVLTP